MLSFAVVFDIVFGGCWELFFPGGEGGGRVLVAGKHVVVEQQLHLAHGVVDKGGLQLAFPDYDGLPAVHDTHSVRFFQNKTA